MICVFIYLILDLEFHYENWKIFVNIRNGNCIVVRRSEALFNIIQTIRFTAQSKL